MESRISPELGASAGRRRWMLVGAAAIFMGLPFLRGGFVGGDDHRLLLNHVLVNHPSLPHALELFRIVHRDLYQPIPLLTFSGEFALAQALGLFDHGVEDGAWLFHLTNVFLHAVNSILAYFVLYRFAERLGVGGGAYKQGFPATMLEPITVATIGAALFAIHPLQVEVVAWLNGRMMLLSTLFALAAALAWMRWLDNGRPVWGLSVLLLVVACMMSKVRVGVPAILLIAAALDHRGTTAGSTWTTWFRHSFVRPRLWPLWLVCAGVTAVFVVINYRTTADSEFFALAGEHMAGPRLVRVLRSLAWYVEHFLLPTGLASWYPASPSVAWSDSETFRALGILLPGTLLVAWAARRWSGVGWGVLWFLCTILDTLPIVPARNLLAADRYMYLSIIGLVWVVGIAAHAALGRLRIHSESFASDLSHENGDRDSVRTPPGRTLRRAAPWAIATAVAATLLAQSWHTGSYYATAVQKTERIATLFPTRPHVWARVAWAYHKAGHAAMSAGRGEEARDLYAKALSCAERELAQRDSHGFSEAAQVIGVTHMKEGRVEQAVQYLERAVEWDPKAAEPRFHLASAYDELGRAAEAVSLYEAIAAEAPGHNPTLLRLARAYRAMGRQGDARAAFERALANNAHEAPATLGLAELEIQQGDRDALIAARNRLDALVNWMPENTAAGVALGVVHHRLGQTDLAIRAYEEVLARNPYEVSALLNLAHIHQAAAEDVRARELFVRASAIVPESVEQLVDLQSYFIGLRALDRVGDLWESYVSRRSPSKEGLAYASFGIALAGRASRAEDLLKSIGDAGNELPLAMAANAYLALTKERFSEAASWVDSLCALGAHAAEARRSLQMGLELFDERRPGVAWTLGLAARLLIADQRWDVAGVFLDLFDKNCNDEGCAEFLRSLRTRMTEETSGRSPAGPSVP